MKMTINVQKLGLDSVQKSSRKGSASPDAPASIYDLIFVGGPTVNEISQSQKELLLKRANLLSFNKVLTDKTTPASQNPDKMVDTAENLLAQTAGLIPPNIQHIDIEKQVSSNNNDSIVSSPKETLPAAQSEIIAPRQIHVDENKAAVETSREYDSTVSKKMTSETNDRLLSVPQDQKAAGVAPDKMNAFIHPSEDTNMPKTHRVLISDSQKVMLETHNTVEQHNEVKQPMAHVSENKFFESQTKQNTDQIIDRVVQEAGWPKDIPDLSVAQNPLNEAYSQVNQALTPNETVIKDTISEVNAQFQASSQIDESGRTDTKVRPADQALADEFMSNLGDAFDKVAVSRSDTQAEGQVSDPDAIARQLTDSIRSADLSDNQLRIQLSPKELGQIKITFETRQEEVVGVIEVSRMATKEQLQTLMPGLIQDIRDAGVEVKELSVSDKLLDQSLTDQGRQFTQQHQDPDQMSDLQERSQLHNPGYKPIDPAASNVSKEVNLHGIPHSKMIDQLA